MSARSLHERIARGQDAILRAKAEGRDVSEWEAHLRRLVAAEHRLGDQAIRVKWPAIHDDPEFHNDVIYFALDEGWAARAPRGAVVYTLAELEAIRGLGSAMLRLLHTAKRAGDVMLEANDSVRRNLLEAVSDIGATPIDVQERSNEMAEDEGLKEEAVMPEPEPQAALEQKLLPEIPKEPQSLEAEVQLPGQPKQKVTVEPLATSEDGTAIIKISAPKPPEKAEGDATGLALLALLGVGAFILLASSKQQPPQPSM